MVCRRTALVPQASVHNLHILSIVFITDVFEHAYGDDVVEGSFIHDNPAS